MNKHIKKQTYKVQDEEWGESKNKGQHQQRVMQHGQKELWEEDAQPWERFKFQAPRVVEPGKLSND